MAATNTAFPSTARVSIIEGEGDLVHHRLDPLATKVTERTVP